MAEETLKVTCDQCGVVVESYGERELERLWEEHKATHKPAPEVTEVDEAATAAVAEELQTRYKNEKDHTDDLASHYEALSHIERRLPQLIDFGFKLANAVGQLCKEKDWRPKALKHGNIYWVPGGEISLEMRYDPHDISAAVEVEYLKKGYARLPRLQAEYPAVFDFVMTMGHHLTNMVKTKKLKAKDLSFTNLHHFENPNDHTQHFAFKMINRRAMLKSAQAKL